MLFTFEKLGYQLITDDNTAYIDQRLIVEVEECSFLFCGLIFQNRTITVACSLCSRAHV